MDNKLMQAAIEQFGGQEDFEERAEDVTQYGIDGGFNDWIYYSDTCEFFQSNRALILKFAQEQASDFGMGLFEMFKSFNCMRSLEVTEEEIAEAIYTNEGECADQIQNCLAWYVAEEACREFVAGREQEGED